ncbi:MAG: hypothetical protein IKQ51_05615 [Bacteroidaceae bacterium]|jgi:hypothetical protein|nr:hypothetical protein [Bacteroidaceae bacterium]
MNPIKDYSKTKQACYLGFMHTIYCDRTVVTPTALGNKTDVYNRKNDVLGVGVTYEF